MWYAEEDRLPHARHLPCQQHENSSPLQCTASAVWSYSKLSAKSTCKPKTPLRWLWNGLFGMLQSRDWTAFEKAESLIYHLFNYDPTLEISKTGEKNKEKINSTDVLQELETWRMRLAHLLCFSLFESEPLMSILCIKLGLQDTIWAITERSRKPVQHTTSCCQT